jgi:Barstar (barnase inhibitor)
MPSNIARTISMANLVSPVDNDTSQTPGGFVVRIPLTIETKNALLEHLRIGLKFPPNYGTNWDAFNESINDLSWLEEKTIILIHDQFPPLPEKDFETYIDILRCAADNWRAEGSKKLIVIFG